MTEDEKKATQVDEIPTDQQELNMQSNERNRESGQRALPRANDNATVPATDPRLGPDAIRACDWACTISGDVSLVEHPDFHRYFGHLSREQVTLAGEEMHRRGLAAHAEADELEAELGNLRGAEDNNDLARFLTRLATRLEAELSEEIEEAKQCDMLEDPNDDTEIVHIYLSIRDWRTAIRNLRIIRDMLNKYEIVPVEAVDN